MRAHRREAIARDPHTVTTRQRDKTVPICRLHRVGVAASRRGPRRCAALRSRRRRRHHRPLTKARLGTALLRRRTGGVSAQISDSAARRGRRDVDHRQHRNRLTLQRHGKSAPPPNAAITRQHAFGGLRTLQKSATPAVVLRTPRRTSNSTNRVSPSPRRIG